MAEEENGATTQGKLNMITESTWAAEILLEPLMSNCSARQGTDDDYHNVSSCLPHIYDRER